MHRDLVHMAGEVLQGGNDPVAPSILLWSSRPQPVEPVLPLFVGVKAAAKQIGESSPPLSIPHDNEMKLLPVGSGRRLLSEREAFLQDSILDRPG